MIKMSARFKTSPTLYWLKCLYEKIAPSVFGIKKSRPHGLPMKLNDRGTILSDTVKMDTFNGKNYLVLNVKYEKGVGTDTWFFYINPTTYALEGYRFNHNRKPNDGEFIVCEDLIEVGGIRMPKVRLWHENETGKYMATDILDKVEDWVGKK